MSYIATVTSKMQLTVPAVVAKKLRLKPGQKVIVSEHKGQAIIAPVATLIEKLAGSLPMPKKWEGKSIEDIISEAKAEHFKKWN